MRQARTTRMLSASSSFLGHRVVGHERLGLIGEGLVHGSFRLPAAISSRASREVARALARVLV